MMGETGMDTVSFVILHYKDRAITDKCIQSILKLENQEQIQIVIVDNDIHKDKNSRKELADFYKGNSRIHVLPVYENGGFSHANNKGYAYAREELQSSWIIAANNDITFEQKDFIKRLEKSRQKHPCHVMGPDIVRLCDGIHQNPMDTRLRTEKEAAYTVRMNHLALTLYPFSFPLVSKMLAEGSQEQDADFYGSMQEDIVPCGACLIFTPDFVKSESLAFTPETQFFYEEYILAYRCRKKGFSILYEPSVKVIHDSAAATKATYKDRKKRLRFMMEQTEKAAKIYLEMILEDGKCTEKQKK